jgi:hypothetical protein
MMASAHTPAVHPVLAQHSLDATEADPELLGYLPGCAARPVEIDHHLKIIRRETIMQTPRADHALGSDLHTRTVVWTAIRQDHSSPQIGHPRLPPDSGGSVSTPPLTAYAVLVQQSFDAAQADTELLSYRLGRGARPVQVDHRLEIPRGETITKTPRPDHALRSHLGTRTIVLTAIQQDHSHLAELLQQVRAVRITSCHPDAKAAGEGPVLKVGGF